MAHWRERPSKVKISGSRPGCPLQSGRLPFFSYQKNLIPESKNATGQDGRCALPLMGVVFDLLYWRLKVGPSWAWHVERCPFHEAHSTCRRQRPSCPFSCFMRKCADNTAAVHCFRTGRTLAVMFGDEKKKPWFQLMAVALCFAQQTTCHRLHDSSCLAHFLLER